MPKSRKKKNAHKDFQKVKLKVGKTLKKADNVTNASFHTRTIQVTQKIKTASTTEPSSKRKLNASELLNQFQHYSTTTRVDAVMGLKDLLSSHKSIIESNLTTILERSAQLFVDKDPVVRQSVIKLLKVVFASLSGKHMAPFFTVMGAHLCCAMTHIYEDIQSDSLQVLDLLLDFFPKMVALNCNQILMNFIEQISRCRIVGNTKSGKPVQIGSSTSTLKTASYKWRAKVLARLHKLLSAILELETGVKRVEAEVPDVMTVKWKLEETSQVHPYPSYIHSRWKQPGFHIRSNIATTQQKSNSITLSDEGGLMRFAQLILPLLMECWVEADTVNTLHGKGTNSLVVADSLPLRTSVVSVIQLLCQFIKNSYPSALVVTTGESGTDATEGWLRKLCLTELQTHLLKSFPYSVHIPAKKKSNEGTQRLEDTVRGLNISICDIMTHFYGGNHQGSKREIILTQYLEDVINSEIQDKQQVKIVTEISNRLVVTGSGANIDSLTKVLLQSYTRSHPLSTDKRMLFHFFSALMLDRRQQKKIGADVIDAFMTSLPDLYLNVAKSNQQMAAQILDVMKTSACQNCWILLQQLNKFICRVAEGGESQFVKQETSMQRKLLELIFYIPQIQKSSLKLLINVLRKTDVPIETCLYFLQILHHKFATMEKNPNNVADYISLMLSVVFGASENNSDDKLASDMVDDVNGHFIVGSSRWERIISLTVAAGSYLIQYGDTEQIVQIVSKFLMTMKFTGSQLVAMLILSNQMGFSSYPITSELTSRVILEFKKFCCTVTSVQSIPSPQKDEFNVKCNTVLPRMVDSACRMYGGVDVLINYMCDDLKEHVQKTDVIELQKICQSQSLWLRYYDNLVQRSTYIVGDSSCISKLTSSIQQSNPELKNLQWWTDFTFLVDRLKL